MTQYLQPYEGVDRSPRRDGRLIETPIIATADASIERDERVMRLVRDVHDTRAALRAFEVAKEQAPRTAKELAASEKDLERYKREHVDVRPRAYERAQQAVLTKDADISAAALEAKRRRIELENAILATSSNVTHLTRELRRQRAAGAAEIGAELRAKLEASIDELRREIPVLEQEQDEARRRGEQAAAERRERQEELVRLDEAYRTARAHADTIRQLAEEASEQERQAHSQMSVVRNAISEGAVLDFDRSRRGSSGPRSSGSLLDLIASAIDDGEPLTAA